MADILELGVTHSPPLPGTDERMAGIVETYIFAACKCFTIFG